MKTKIFPPPAPPFSASDNLDRLKDEKGITDPYPWGARVLGVLLSMIGVGLLIMVIFGILPGDVEDISTLLIIFGIGASIPFVFGIPFLWK